MSKLVQQMVDAGLVRRGDFTLKSGRKSDLYFDFRRLISHPKLMSALVDRVVDWLPRGLNYHLVGVPHGAVPLAAMVAHRAEKSLLMLRKEVKEHGTGQLVEGEYSVGDSVVLLDDVWTTGGSLEAAQRQLEEAGLKIASRLVLLDRSEEGAIGTARLFTECDFRPPTQADRFAELTRLIEEKKTRTCFSGDLPTVGEVVELVHRLGPEIVMVKIHLDSLVDVSGPADLEPLIEECRTQRVLICDDRKLGDIGSTNMKYLDRWGHDHWCDFLTVHANPGVDSLRPLAERIGLLLVAEMSTVDEPIEVVARRVEIAEQLGCGMVAQDLRGIQTSLFKATPGISLWVKREGDQRYRSPEEAVADGSQLLIVGRGLYRFPEAAEQYASRGWGLEE